jgi:endonuclease/exonuclease/phosphatase (EEP) superfamily protein YafD
VHVKRISWLAAAFAAGWGVARLTAADRRRGIEAPAAPLLSFTPQVTAAALLSPLVLRRKGAAAIAVLAGAALAAVVLPRARRRPQPMTRGPVLRVVTANLMHGRADEDAIVGLVRRTGADVLFLQELNETAVIRLKQAGLTDLLPHEIVDVRGASARGSGIYARYPLGNGLSIAPISIAQPTARMELPGGQHADLICVHPHPPKPPWSRRNAARWREELTVLPPPADPAADPPRVLAGDFNATADHAYFRDLLEMGHVDAASQVGKGLVPTWAPWPPRAPRGTWGGPGLLTIDHVLVDPRCAVLAASVHRLPGSDHRAVYAEFRLPG